MTKEIDFFKKGYDAYVELWATLGYRPGASDCPARRMPDGDARSEFIRGWVKAKREAENGTS